jgi:ParB family chromosome partitioning protein
MAKEKRLGKGLSALFESEVEENQLSENLNAGEQIRNINVNILEKGKYQPRSYFSEESLKELSDSILEQGLMQPIIARKINDTHFEIIAGERRWRAAKLAKITEVPVIVREINDKTASIIALIENMQREDLTALEEANGIKKMIEEFGMTHEEAASAVGKSRTTVSNLLRLLQLSSFVKGKLESGQIEMGHARALISLEADKQNMLCEKIIKEKLSVRAVEDLVSNVQFTNKKTKPKYVIKKSMDLIKIEQELSDFIGFPVDIENKSNNNGYIKIRYRNLNELDDLLKTLNKTN